MEKNVKLMEKKLLAMKYNSRKINKYKIKWWIFLNTYFVFAFGVSKCRGPSSLSLLPDYFT